MACRWGFSSSGAGTSTRASCGQRAGWSRSCASGKRVAKAPQPPELGGLDRLAQEAHVAVDLGLVQARAVEMGLGEAVDRAELLLDPRPRHALVELRGLDH